MLTSSATPLFLRKIYPSCEAMLIESKPHKVELCPVVSIEFFGHLIEGEMQSYAQSE